eukprot:TRINITY_DN9957_c0_g1_i1.p1 TRINITY_DN9957_c0_g1~~TRINITY_DN9957_c0_g1_i1.p1  ORF type:complete len:147 (+),score=46.19 TRINITY_DN9957_c0_g1_i1:182-622(+)
MPLRQIDADTHSRDDQVCGICGESFGTYEQLFNHTNYNVALEELEMPEIKIRHKKIPPPAKPISPNIQIKQVLDRMKAKKMEIVVVLEGIDPPTSCTIQARHSYCIEDMLVNHEFAQCVYHSSNKDDHLIMDFEHFHNVTPMENGI